MILCIIFFHTSVDFSIGLESLFTLEGIVHWKACKGENQAFCESKEQLEPLEHQQTNHQDFWILL